LAQGFQLVAINFGMF